MKVVNIFKKRDNLLEEHIELLTEMLLEEPYGTERYESIVNHLERLVKLNQQNDKTISPDTLAVVVGNLIGITLILKHENFNVITSKAMGFVLRGRA